MTLLTPAIIQDFNFELSYTIPADLAWGVQFENGSFNGMVGQLNRSEADICTAGLNMNLPRAQAVDYGVGLARNTLGIIVSADSVGEKVNYWVFVRVFLADSWKGTIKKLL